MTDNTRKESIAEKVRFLAVGGFNTIVGLSVFSLIQLVSDGQLHEIVVLILSHIISSTSAFYLHRKVVFRVDDPSIADFLRFQSVYIVPLGFNAVALPVLVRVMGANVYLAQILITAVNVIASYFGHKYFSFRRNPTA